MKTMSKFATKAFECTTLDNLVKYLQNEKDWYYFTDENGKKYPENEEGADKIEIIDGIIAKLEKLV